MSGPRSFWLNRSDETGKDLWATPGPCDLGDFVQPCEYFCMTCPLLLSPGSCSTEVRMAYWNPTSVPMKQRCICSGMQSKELESTIAAKGRLEEAFSRSMAELR